MIQRESFVRNTSPAVSSSGDRPDRGRRDREVAAVLFIAPGTVRKHLDNVYAKLGVRSRAQAVAVTVDCGQSALIAESQALESRHD